MTIFNNSCNEYTCPTNFLDLVFCRMREIFGLHDEGLLWQMTFSKHLMEAKSADVNNRSFIRNSGVLCTSFLRNKRPNFVQIYCRTVIIVFSHVKISHTDLKLISGLIHKSTLVHNVRN